MEHLIRKSMGNICMIDTMTPQDLRIHIVTFNVFQKSPNGKPLNDIVGLPEKPEEITNLPDFYAIGLQEVKSQPQNIVIDAVFNDPWTKQFGETLEPFGYVRVKTVRLLTMVLDFYCLRKHISHLRNIEFNCTRTGAKGFWEWFLHFERIFLPKKKIVTTHDEGSKGGIALRFQLYGTTICFVTCHLPAHDENLQERIHDFNSIQNSIKFNSSGSSTISQHDYIFWFGDLNFRLNKEDTLPAEEISNLLQKGNLESLLEIDQLRAVQKSGEAFSELSEAVIDFKPSFKYLVDSTSYDLGRRPAWCDRILYRVNKSIPDKKDFSVEAENYKSIEHFTVSDHRPVTASFTIKVFRTYREKCVDFLPVTTWFKNNENKVVIIFGPDYTPSKNDWVGIFYDDFTSLNDYCGYMYVTDSEEGKINFNALGPGDSIHLLFDDENVLKLCPRGYVLLYITNDGTVMGMSCPFELKVDGAPRERKPSYRPLHAL